MILRREFQLEVVAVVLLNYDHKFKVGFFLEAFPSEMKPGLKRCENAPQLLRYPSDSKHTMKLKFSDNLIACLSSFLFKLDSDDDADRNLVSDIVSASLKDFSQVSGNHEEHTLLLKECFLPQLHCAVSSTAASLARKSPELDKKLGFRVRTLKRYLARFEPAMYEAIVMHFIQMGANDVLFGAKVSGAQVGTVAEVVYEDGRRVKYFIKCSRTFYENGKMLDRALKDKVELVDYKELFAYRVLEKLGLGPKVEFILAPEVVGPTATDKTAVLIATEDLTATSPPSDLGSTSGESSHFLSHFSLPISRTQWWWRSA